MAKAKKPASNEEFDDEEIEKEEEDSSVKDEGDTKEEKPEEKKSRARAQEDGKHGDLRPNKALLHVRMNRARRLPCRGALANWPRAVFLAADGQERDVAGVGESAQ